MENLYNQLKEAGIPLDNHYSDLYVKVTPESTKIIDAYREANHYKGMPEIFTNQIDKMPWYDIPFAYKPYWDAKAEAK